MFKDFYPLNNLIVSLWLLWCSYSHAPLQREPRCPAACGPEAAGGGSLVLGACLSPHLESLEAVLLGEAAAISECCSCLVCGNI